MTGIVLKQEPPIQKVFMAGREVDVLRLDLIDPFYGGNKFFKLKYNLIRAKELGFNRILTFGGAHSNHLYSTAAACKEFGFQLIAVVRGEESLLTQSPTLQFLKQTNAQLEFVSREMYRRKNEIDFQEQLQQKHGPSYIVPEGGANEEGVKGCMEILKKEMTHDLVFCACGTAATFSGIYLSAKENQRVIGISVLKGENQLIHVVNKWVQKFGGRSLIEVHNNLFSSTILNTYHLGGYAVYHPELIAFKFEFERASQTTLDHVYTSKLFYAVNDLITFGKIKNTERVLVIHSGGQQGNAGFEARYQASPMR